MKTTSVSKTLATIRALGLTAQHRNGEYAVNFKDGAEATRYYTPHADDAVRTARHMAQQEFNKRTDEFLERRAAMRHAIRVLRERGTDPTIDAHDADTLEAWLVELQAQS